MTKTMQKDAPECEVCLKRATRSVGRPPAHFCGVHYNQFKRRVGIEFHIQAWTRTSVRRAMGFLLP